MTLEWTEVQVDIDSFSDERFIVEESILQAKETIKKLRLEKRWLEGDFEDDEWVVSDIVTSGYYKYFNFSPINSLVFSKELPKNFKEMVKCWTVNLVELYKQPNEKFSRFIKSFELTMGFKKSEVSNLLKHIEHFEGIDNNKHAMINSVCNFFDYVDLELGENYVPALMELKSKLPFKTSVRGLPSSKHVLTFSYYLDKHFEELLSQSNKQKEIEKELLLVYPLVIWWNLTNIIPMRAHEFSSIERECLLVEKDNYYIRLPRQKLKNTNRIQILDKLLIDKNMYHLIKQYIDLTESYGETETLISYPSIIHGTSTEIVKAARETLTRNKTRFKRSQLYHLLKSFYRILKEKHGYDVTLENRVRPNDTRHFAFISLMMQGYSPVEIARLGGHSTIQAQYHYSAHSEYWVDCETFKLMKKVKNQNNVSVHTSSIPVEVKKKAMEGNYIGFKRKMNVGYCKDEEQRCESRKCYFCSHWGISAEEYKQKKERIRNEIGAIKNNINELTTVLFNLNKQFLTNELSRRNPEYLNSIKTESNKIQSELYKLAMLCEKLGEEEVLDGEISWT